MVASSAGGKVNLKRRGDATLTGVPNIMVGDPGLNVPPNVEVGLKHGQEIAVDQTVRIWVSQKKQPTVRLNLVPSTEIGVYGPTGHPAQKPADKDTRTEVEDATAQNLNTAVKYVRDRATKRNSVSSNTVPLMADGAHGEDLEHATNLAMAGPGNAPEIARILSHNMEVEIVQDWV